MTDAERGAWMQTASGGRYYIHDPQPHEIMLREISHSLSMICRFNGHCMRFYSVAQHCVLVSRLVPPEYAVHGLLHDASEAYVGDVIRPIKSGMPAFYTRLENKALRAIGHRFGIDMFDADAWALVHHADNLALAIERRDVMIPTADDWQLPSADGHPRIHPVVPLEAKIMFEQRCRALGLPLDTEPELWKCQRCGQRKHNDECMVPV